MLKLDSLLLFDAHLSLLLGLIQFFFDFKPLEDLLFLLDVLSDFEVLLEADTTFGPASDDVCAASLPSLLMSTLRSVGAVIAIGYSSFPGAVRMRLSSQSMS